MTEPATPSARRQATRERLLEAAAEVFAEEGLQGASVETICHRAGFTRGAFYSNFTSKEELFLALLEREFERRAADLSAKTKELSPALRGRGGLISPALATEFITEFLSLGTNSTSWYMLEAEFGLLAMRDPEVAPNYAEFLQRSYSSLADAVETALTVAGRRFTLPAEHSVQILGGEYERALRITALSGPDAAGGLHHLPENISELLFAITEPIAKKK
ncbi:MAG: TetR/AcrR family transcriptional regulator [Microbacteriaceae bacterium]|jgi:AcrR family transcriptional regulator|nr:TetR/AcrR family transcriptional regulator [Microbacteriaceae bacterium]